MVFMVIYGDLGDVNGVIDYVLIVKLFFSLGIYLKDIILDVDWLVAKTLSCGASITGWALAAWISLSIDWGSLDITWVGEVADDVLDVEGSGDLFGDSAGPDILLVSEGATDGLGIGPDNLGVGGGFTISN